MWEEEEPEEEEQEEEVKSFSRLMSEMHFSVCAPKGSVILLGVQDFTPDPSAGLK